jgi:hypothetical protein
VGGRADDFRAGIQLLDLRGSEESDRLGLAGASDALAREERLPDVGFAVAHGRNRGLWQTRIPLEGCGALVFPDMFALPHANDAFDQNGNLRDATLAERLHREVVGFVRLAEAIVPICGQPPSAEAVKRQKEIVAALEDETEIQPRRVRRGVEVGGRSQPQSGAGRLPNLKRGGSPRRKPGVPNAATMEIRVLASRLPVEDSEWIESPARA